MTRPKVLIALNSCSAAGQGFYKFFCPGSKSVCLSDLVYEANSFIIEFCTARSTPVTGLEIPVNGSWI